MKHLRGTPIARRRRPLANVAIERPSAVWKTNLQDRFARALHARPMNTKIAARKKAVCASLRTGEWPRASPLVACASGCQRAPTLSFRRSPYTSSQRYIRRASRPEHADRKVYHRTGHRLGRTRCRLRPRCERAGVRLHIAHAAAAGGIGASWPRRHGGHPRGIPRRSRAGLGLRPVGRTAVRRHRSQSRRERLLVTRG